MRYDGQKTWRQELKDILIGGAVLAGLAVSCIGPISWCKAREDRERKGQETALWEEFEGNIQGYKVSIDESKNKKGYSIKLVHLDATDPESRPARITGYDYGIDGHFERVFIMDGRYSGCNSVLFTDKGVIWDSCDANEREKVPQFSPEQLIDAQRKIYDALDSVRNESNKTRHWVAGMGDKDNYGLIQKVEKAESR